MTTYKERRDIYELAAILAFAVDVILTALNSLVIMNFYLTIATLILAVIVGILVLWDIFNYLHELDERTAHLKK